MLKYFLYALIFSTIVSKSFFDYSHKTKDPLIIQAGSITSVKNPVPFNYYHLNICKPDKVEKEEDNLGEILTGEEIYKTQYEVLTNVNEYCKVVCLENFSEAKIKNMEWIFNRKYVTNWYVDKLPAGLFSYNPITKVTQIDYFSGIPIGYNITEDGQKDIYIYNHFQFRILIHKLEEDTFEVVGFTIMPLSILHEDDGEKPSCAKRPEDLEENYQKRKQILKPGKILFTYDVIFEESNLTLASRWDHYKHENKEIHLVGVITSNVLIVLCSLIVICIFCRSIRKDIEIYNSRVTNEDFLDEYGWKQVCNDVFRPCQNTMLLSACIGTGIQLFLMLFLTLLFACVGFMKPERRSNILTLGILFFVFMGIFGGYFSARIYRILNGKYWLKTAVLTAVLFPGLVFAGYSFINILLAMEKSSAAVNFLDILSLLVLWLCCSSPLVLIGSFFGIKGRAVRIPCKVNAVPTAVPDKPWYFRFKMTFWIAGLFSFSTIFVEFVYIMASIWQHQIYFLVTFLWIGICVMIIVSSEIVIILIYINLCKGDYNWWWKSFFFGGSAAAYFILYSVYYFLFALKITRLSAIFVYIGLMGLITAVMFLICGAVSTVITFEFLRLIYSKIKID